MLHNTIRGRNWQDLREVEIREPPTPKEVADDVNMQLYWLMNCSPLSLAENEKFIMEEVREICIQIADGRIR